MSRYRKVEVKTWVDNKFRHLSPMLPSGRGLWLFLMTGPFTGPIPGLFRAGRAAMAEELEWDIEAFDEAFQEVSSQGMAKADFKARLVWLPNALKHNKPESPNVVRSWRDELELLPECDLKNEAIIAIRNHLEMLGTAYLQAFDEILTDENKPLAKASSKPKRKTTPNQEQEQEQEQKNTLSDSNRNRTDDVKPASPEKPPAPEKPEPEQSANRDAGIEPEPGADQVPEHAGESDPPDKTDDRDKPGEPDPVDQAFGEIFWQAGLCKVGKVKACSAFRSKYRGWKKLTRDSPSEFASMLADDIRRRLSAGVFGMDKLHPATYLNQERWNDELPEASTSAAGGGGQVRDVSHLSEEQRQELAMYELLEGR